MYSFIRAWINGWVNNREAGDLRRHRAHNDVIVMFRTYSEFNDFDIPCLSQESISIIYRMRTETPLFSNKSQKYIPATIINNE